MSLLWVATLLAACSVGSLLTSVDGQTTAALDPELSGNLPFPYCDCNRFRGLYSFPTATYSGTVNGSNVYCFTLDVNTCNYECCNVKTVGLKKVEFDIKPECATKYLHIGATVNGRPTRIGPNIYRAPESTTGGTVLRITGLNLTADSVGAKICISLGGPSNCTTLPALCRNYNVFGRGCPAALFSTNSSSGCCPISYPSLARPPLPPSPPSPSPPSPPPSCRSCITVALLPPLQQRPPFFSLTNPICAALQTQLAAAIDGVLTPLAAAGSIMPPLVPFSSGISGVCDSPLNFTVCGTYFSQADGRTAEEAVQSVVDLWLGGLLDSVCVLGSGFTLTATSTGGCSDIRSGTACEQPPPNNLPNCKCNKVRGITELYLDPVVTVRQGRPPAKKLFCFTIRQEPPEERNCGTGLAKMEIWADPAYRANVTGLRIKRAGGEARYRNVNWGAPEDQSIKITPLNWNTTQADGAEVCVEVTRNLTLEQLCMGDGPCYASLFSLGGNCCPLYPAAPAPDFFPPA